MYLSSLQLTTTKSIPRAELSFPLTAAGRSGPHRMPQGNSGGGVTAAMENGLWVHDFREVLGKQGPILCCQKKGNSVTQCLTKCYSESRWLREKLQLVKKWQSPSDLFVSLCHLVVASFDTDILWSDTHRGTQVGPSQTRPWDPAVTVRPILTILGDGFIFDISMYDI